MGFFDEIIKPFEEIGAVAGDPGAWARKKMKDEKEAEARATAAAAPGIEMARRNAIPLMTDEKSIEEARRRALSNQMQRGGRGSTMLSAGLGK